MAGWTKMNNPILLENENINNLKEAKRLFITVLEEYLVKNPDMQDEISELKKETELAYLKRKSEFLLQNRIEHLNDVFSNSLSYTLESFESKDMPTSQLYYLKQSKRFTLNE